MSSSVVAFAFGVSIISFIGEVHAFQFRHLHRLEQGTGMSKQSPLLMPLKSTTTASTETFFDSVPASSSSSSNDDDKKFDKFDYYNHWYPVIWKDDLVYNEPTKITLFDVDYVVSKIQNENTGDDEVIALQDICPHKLAKLSQGRVTSTGNIQCSYHGWSFNGKTGSCVEIPQVVSAIDKTTEDDDNAQSMMSMPSFVTASEKSKATAIPVMIQYGMVWMFPGGNLEKALLAPPPPTIPELEEEGGDLIIGSISMRDMPIDFPILISNICDPDQLSILNIREIAGLFVCFILFLRYTHRRCTVTLLSRFHFYVLTQWSICTSK